MIELILELLKKIIDLLKSFKCYCKYGCFTGYDRDKDE